MLGGKWNAWLSFSLGLAVSVFLCARVPDQRVPSASVCRAALFLPAAAGGLALLRLVSPRARRSGVLLLSLALGGAAGTARLLPLVSVRGFEDHSDPGVDRRLRSVTWFEGVLLADPTRPPAAQSAQGSGAGPADRHFQLRPFGAQSAAQARTAAAVELLLLIRVDRAGGEDFGVELQGRALVYVTFGGRLFRGQRVRVQGRLERTAAAGADGVRWIGRAGRRSVRSIGFSNPLGAWRARLLLDLGRRIDGMGAPASALFRALMLGEKEELPEATVRAFTRSGSLHLLALSGLHVGLLVLLATWVLGFLPGRSWRACAGAVVAAAYLFLVGLRPSLIRAVLMVGAGAAGRSMHREPDTLNLLALSAALVLLIDPASLGSLSFRLSYAALLGILWLGRRASRPLSRWLPPILAGPLAVSIGAGLATAPILLSAFGVIYPVGMLSAPAVVPLVTLFIGSGLVWLPLAAGAEALGAYGAARAACRMLDLLCRAIVSVLELCARAPGLVLEGRRLFWWTAAVLMLPAGIAGCRAWRRRRVFRLRAAGPEAAGTAAPAAAEEEGREAA